MWGFLVLSAGVLSAGVFSAGVLCAGVFSLLLAFMLLKKIPLPLP